jgi:tripartite-type tricarboxylate transporter receptor subunit TctC
LNYASAGNGTTTHLAMEMLKSVAGMDIVHIPFNGNGPANTAVLGGQVQALFGSMPAVLPQAKAGKLRPLAVGTAKRSPAFPDVPTVAESGYPGYEASLWLGFIAPKGTPKPIVERLHKEVTDTLKSPAIAKLLARDGALPNPETPESFARFLADEHKKWVNVVQKAGITRN